MDTFAYEDRGLENDPPPRRKPVDAAQDWCDTGVGDMQVSAIKLTSSGTARSLSERVTPPAFGFCTSRPSAVCDSGTTKSEILLL